MDCLNRSKQVITRREFLRSIAFVSAGAMGYSLGWKPCFVQATTPGVTGNRVIWVHDGQATSWNGTTGHYRDHVDQSRVDKMIERGVIELTGESSSIGAWQQIIPNYSQGKKIAIKVNINNSANDTSIDALPQPVNGVIAGLKSIGVAESDIYVMEPSRTFPTAIGDPILTKYPDVYIWDVSWGQTYGNGTSYNSGDPSLTIRHGLYPSLTDSKLPDQLKDASYLINMPILKGHYQMAEITLTFKNNFGFFRPGTSISKFHSYCFPASGSYSYANNPLIDIYQNTHIKDKTVLIIGDALFAHRITNSGIPEVWNTFGGEFPNSLFFSSDPVAIDSVMWDFSNAEYAKVTEGQLYLHRAMEVGLGTHEHWNNATDKSYTTIDFVKSDMADVRRLDIDREIKKFKDGHSEEQDVKDLIKEYMEPT